MPVNTAQYGEQPIQEHYFFNNLSSRVPYVFEKKPQNFSALVSTNGMHCILLSRMQWRWCTLPGSCYLSDCFKEVEHLIKDTLNFLSLLFCFSPLVQRHYIFHV